MPMCDKKCFLPILHYQADIEATTPNGEVIDVLFEREGRDFDGDQLIDLMRSFMRRHELPHVYITSEAGTLQIAPILDLGSIVTWAIENGYLESLGSEPVASSPV